MRIFFKTYGCTLNKADTAKMKALAIEKGHSLANNEEEAELVVVNTCTVKAATESKICHYLKSLKKEGKKFVVGGCLSAVDKGLAKQFNTAILNPYDLGAIDEAIQEANRRQAKVHFSLQRKDALPIHIERPIHPIGIQEGCTSHCTFCQTKLARPKLQSRSIEDIKREIKAAMGEDVVEIDLAGTDTGAYGLDIGTDLAHLLEAVEQTIPTIKGRPMVRVGMANPHHIKRLGAGLVEVMKAKHIYNFLHTSVQTGSEKVAKEMRRDHTVKDFVDIAKAYKKAFGERNITVETDIIVGYPTETEEDFEKTLHLIEHVAPDVINLSKFTPRKGTVAAQLKQLPTETIKKRSVEAARLIKEVHERRNEWWIGKEVEALVTEKGKGRLYNYKQLVIKDEWNDNLMGKHIACVVDSVTHTSLICKKHSLTIREDWEAVR